MGWERRKVGGGGMAHDVVRNALKGRVVERDDEVPGGTAATARTTSGPGCSTGVGHPLEPGVVERGVQYFVDPVQLQALARQRVQEEAIVAWSAEHRELATREPQDRDGAGLPTYGADAVREDSVML